MHFTTLTTCLAFGTTGWAAYTLQDDYFAGGDFFDQFTFWNSENEEDPTHGFVAYKDRDSASQMNLINSTNGNAQMHADTTEKSSSGRAAVRITSNKSYQSGLIIADIDHMPGGTCGTWPAFWTTGPDWPHQGEIDIVEGVNDQTTNKYTLHTGPSCSISQGGGGSGGSDGWKRDIAFSGTVDTSNCDVSNGGDNTGCGIKTTDTQTYGEGFNQNEGGVFATEWTGTGISVYFFPRNAIPDDINNGSPDPSSWGTPQAAFQGNCDFGKSFTNQQIVFTNTFCGDWAGADDVWSQSCAAKTGMSCKDYVQNHPADFAEAYWSVNALKVYQNDGSGSEPEPSAAPSSVAPWGINATESAGVPATGAPPATSAPAPPASTSDAGWAPSASDPSWGQPTSAPAAPAPSSPAETQWDHQPPTNTWGGGNPWQSDSGNPWDDGGWAEQREDDGAWSVGTPAKERRHARHLLQHKRHAAGRLS